MKNRSTQDPFPEEVTNRPRDLRLIAMSGAVEREALHAVTARLYALGFPSTLCIVAGRGHEWLIALEVSEVDA